MKDFVRNHRKLAAIMGVVIVVVAAWMLSDATAFIQGESLARVDIARGRYVELGYGLPAPWVPEYTRLLRERYGVEHRPVAGCLVSKSLVSFVRAYNSVSTAPPNAGSDTTSSRSRATTLREIGSRKS
jgi:hypothetical protein